MTDTTPTIVEDTANRLYSVTPTALDHLWLGLPVKRSKGGFVPKAGAREVPVRKAGCRVLQVAS